MPVVSNKVVELADTPAKADDYITVNGLRLVKPYYFDFLCSVKKRWLGMTIIDVFSEDSCRNLPLGQEAITRKHLQMVDSG